MEIDVREAASGDVEVVAAILTEAAEWLESSGMGMWRANELSPAQISTDVAKGLFYLAHAGQPVGTIKYQLSDVEFWPDLPEGQSAFVHRLAVGEHVPSSKSMFCSVRYSEYWGQPLCDVRVARCSASR